MKYQSVKGMEDILPQDSRIWQELERIARIELESNGYREIRTPILEETSVFTRSIGETTDIVSKEMYTFEDRKGRSLTLRPEGTAPIVRAYVEHSLNQLDPQLRLYYIGPMFRAERPQKGRSRQFYQIGAEIIGSREPQMDAEIVLRLKNLLEYFGLGGFSIKLNSLGCKEDKAKFKERLSLYLKDKKTGLCDDCKVRAEKNVLRALDCKNETCIQILRDAPNIIDSLCADCKDHFDKVKELMGVFNIGFVEAKNLVRGLDYYTGTVFEINHSDLGSQDAIGAGGRYDTLVKEFGGPDVGAVGFAIGMERVIIALGEKKEQLNKSKLVCIIPLGNNAKIAGMKLAADLRRKLNGLPTERSYALNIITRLNLDDASLNSQMRSANKNNAELVIILGEDELKNNSVSIKDMKKKDEQLLVKMDRVVDEIGKRLGLPC